MDSPTLNTFSQDFFIDFELEHLIDVHATASEHVIELLSLDNGTGETIEKDSTLALRVAEVVIDEANDELVGNEFSALHDSIGLLSELSASLNSITEHIAGSQVADAEIILDLGALSTFTRAWWSNHNDVLGGAL